MIATDRNFEHRVGEPIELVRKKNVGEFALNVSIRSFLSFVKSSKFISEPFLLAFLLASLRSRRHQRVTPQRVVEHHNNFVNGSWRICCRFPESTNRTDWVVLTQSGHDRSSLPFFKDSGGSGVVELVRDKTSTKSLVSAIASFERNACGVGIRNSPNSSTAPRHDLPKFGPGQV